MPPPHDADDAYSAPTRVGTLPEELLAAMREQDLVRGNERGKRMPRPSPPPLARPKSGARPIAVIPLAAAPLAGAPTYADLPITVTLEEEPPSPPSSTLVPPALSCHTARCESAIVPFAPVRVIELRPASNLDRDFGDVPEFRSSLGPRIALAVAFGLGMAVAVLILFT